MNSLKKNEIWHQMLLDFIDRNYPIQRMKDAHGHRFKRAVILDGGTVYFLSDDNQFQSMIDHLFDNLKKIFYFSDKEIKEAIFDYFDLK